MRARPWWLLISVLSIAIPSSGFGMLRVDPDPELIDTLGFGADGPTGITYHEKRNTLFIVTDESGRVYELELDGTVLNSFPVVNTPQGIAYDPVTMDLLVADGEGEVRRYNESGASVGPVPFLDLTPTDSGDADGIAVHPGTGNIWIADDVDERIYEFDRMGMEISRFDTDVANDDLDEPEGLSFFQGDLVVADNGGGTRAIYLFSTDGELLETVVRTQPGGLDDPEGVTVLPDGGIAVVGDEDDLLGFYDALTGAAAPALSWLGLAASLLLLGGVARRRI